MPNLHGYHIKRLKRFAFPAIEIDLEQYLRNTCDIDNYRLDVYLHTDFEEIVIRVTRMDRMVHREFLTRLTFLDIRYMREDDVLRSMQFKVEELAKKIKVYEKV